MLARKAAQADLDLDLPICDMPTWDSLPQRHRISAVPGKRGERWAADRRPRTPLEVGPSFVLFPGGRIVVHRQWDSPPCDKDGADRVRAGKGEGRLAAGRLAGWEKEQVWCPKALARDWRGFCKIRFPGQLGVVWVPRRRPKPPRQRWLRVFASSSGCLSFLVLGLSGPVCPICHLQPAQPSFALCVQYCPDPIPPII